MMIVGLWGEVITMEDGPPWEKAPEWVGWWTAEVWGGSWFWHEEPVLREGGYWVPNSGNTPLFAGWFDMITGEEWKTLKLKRPVEGEEIFIPLVKK